MRKRVVLLLLVGILGLCLLVIGSYCFMLFDPFERGAVRSSKFSWEKFALVKNGERIEAVIARLGEPVRKPYKISVMTMNPADPCVSGGCKEYIFAGASWGASYKEAIVITDRAGRVIRAQARQE